MAIPTRDAMDFAMLANEFACKFNRIDCACVIAQLWAEFREQCQSESLGDWRFVIGMVKNETVGFKMPEDNAMKSKSAGHMCRRCLVWNTEVRQKCGRCSRTYYCSAKCHREDWPSHKRECRQILEGLDNLLGNWDERPVSTTSPHNRQLYQKAVIELTVLYKLRKGLVIEGENIDTALVDRSRVLRSKLDKQENFIIDDMMTISMKQDDDDCGDFAKMTTDDICDIMEKRCDFLLAYKPGEGSFSWCISSC